MIPERDGTGGSNIAERRTVRADDGFLRFREESEKRGFDRAEVEEPVGVIKIDVGDDRERRGEREKGVTVFARLGKKNIVATDPPSAPTRGKRRAARHGRVEPPRREDRGEHTDGRTFAVHAGDGDPRGRLLHQCCEKIRTGEERQPALPCVTHGGGILPHRCRKDKQVGVLGVRRFLRFDGDAETEQGVRRGT